MRCLTLHLVVALLTFTIGVSIASFWFFSRQSFSKSSKVTASENNSAPHTPSPKTLTDDRDLSLYDFGGHQGCGNVLASEIPRCKASIKKARGFIWKHWQDKKRGYVIVKMASVDAQSDAHIFIEPDKSGAWHVVWKWERIFAASIAENISGRIDEVPDIRSVERRIGTAVDYEYAHGTSFLLFLGEDGEKIQSL